MTTEKLLTLYQKNLLDGRKTGHNTKLALFAVCASYLLVISCVGKAHEAIFKQIKKVRNYLLN